MPIIERKVVHSFSSEDSNFPASNLLETRVTKKYKCKEVGEKLVFVVFKLVKPTQIVTIDIGNEHSAFIEVFVANSKQNTPEFKEILIASSFMTPVESRKSENPNRVRCFNKSTLIEGTSDEKWDLVKIVCTQPFARVQYGLSFITLHSPSEESDKDENGFKCEPDQKSSEKSRKFGKFFLRNDSDEDVDKKDESLSAYHKWKLSKDDKNASAAPATKSTTLSTSSAKTTIKEKVQTMKENEKRKRIVLMDDSSDEEISKPKQSRSRTNLMYDEDDELPNEKMEEKMNKDRESSKKSSNKDDHKKRDKTPPRTDSKNKFSSFITDETPPKSKSSSSSSHHHKSSSSSSRDKRDTPSKSSSHSSRSESKSTEKKSSSHTSSRSTHKDSPSKSSSSHTSRRNSKDSPDKKSSSRSKSKSTPDKRTSSSRSSIPSPSNTNVSYKPFGKMLEGVVIVFSGYQNPERGILRQKAIDMGAKYKADWEKSCTHLICAFRNTPKFNEVKGKGKIVSKAWIEKCFQEQKKVSWRKYALDDNDRKQSDSEDEIVNILLKPASTTAVEETEESTDLPAKDNDSSIEIISPKKTQIDLSSDEDMDIVDNRKPNPSIATVQESIKNGSIKKEKDISNATTDEDVDHKQDDYSFENTQNEAPLFNSKTFFLTTDLKATDVVKLEKFIPSMKGKIIKDALIANYVVTNLGKNLPKGMKGEAVKALWIYETVEMECLIPIQRYKFDV